MSPAFFSTSSHLRAWPIFANISRASALGNSFFSIGRFCLTMWAMRFSMACRSSGVKGLSTLKS